MRSSRDSLRVALIRQRYTPYGGAERFVERALGEMTRQPLQISLLTRRWSGDGDYRVMPCDPPYLGRLWRDWSFARCVCARVRKGGFDLVQSHERIACCDLYRAGDGVHREWLRQRARVLGPAARLAQAVNPYHRYILKAERALFESPRIRAIVCNSEMVKAEVRHYYRVPEQKLHVVYNGVDTHAFGPDLRNVHRARVRAQWALPNDALLLLFVGSGFRRKGLEMAIRALAALPGNYALLVVGRDRDAGWYQRLAHRLGLQDRLRFAGPQEDVKPFYGAADVLVLPTLYDPFPNVVFEAMASALPVVTSSKCGASDLIETGENGFLCDALDQDALVQHLLALESASRRRQVGRAARETVLPMRLDAMATKLMSLYARLLDPGNRSTLSSLREMWPQA